MARVVFTSPVCRLELNLNEDDAVVVADVLLELVKRRRPGAVPAAAAAAAGEVPVHALRVAEPEAAQITAPEPGPGTGDPGPERKAPAHQAKRGLPKVTAVLGSMKFPCPHDGCGRVYDDENRLNHHLRVIHEPAVAHGEERVVLSDAEVVHGLNAGTLRGVKVG